MATHAPIFRSRAEAVGLELTPEVSLPWLTRHGHVLPAVRDRLPEWATVAIDRIFRVLGGDEALLAGKTRGSMRADFLLMPHEVEVEYDEIQHFTASRLTTLEMYPAKAELAFQPAEYASIVQTWRLKGDRGFAHKLAAEFPGPNGRARQRAYFDAFRDLAAPFFGNGPVLRVAAPDNDYEEAVVQLQRLASRLTP